MRKSLSALTTRGRSFVAAGLTAIVCAFILGERDLLRAGVLVLAMPLLSSLAVARARYRLACARGFGPSRLPAGQETRVDLRLDNVSRLPTGLLLVEDQVPYPLGGRARFVLGRIEPRGSRVLSYRIRSDVRGRYTVGPVTVRLADPFGLVEQARSFSLTDTLTVTPVIVPLPHGRLASVWTGGGESRARRLSTAGENDVSPREYRHGDDLRRVHWRSTARRGELMVRREEQQWQSKGALYLDTRKHVHRGEGPGSSFEQAVSAAASIGIRLSGEGFALRFVTDAGEVLAPAASSEGALLDALSIVRTSVNRSSAHGLSTLRTAIGSGPEGDGLVVGVFGALDPAEARSVAALRRGTAICVAVLVDGTAPPGTEEDAGPAESGTAARILQAAGWRVATIASAAALATAWAHTDRTTGSAGSAAAVPPSGAATRTEQTAP